MRRVHVATTVTMLAIASTSANADAQYAPQSCTGISGPCVEVLVNSFTTGDTGEAILGSDQSTSAGPPAPNQIAGVNGYSQYNLGVSGESQYSAGVNGTTVSGPAGVVGTSTGVVGVLAAGVQGNSNYIGLEGQSGPNSLNGCPMLTPMSSGVSAWISLHQCR